mgnify:CR=1 FL=1
MTDTAEIAIIGAGVQGASLAFYLARAGAGKIVLLDKNYVAGGPTAKSGAMIRPLFKRRGLYSVGAGRNDRIRTLG